MHDDFGIGIAGQIVVVVVQQLLFQLGKVGQLAVESETEPLVLFDVVAFEWLGVAAVGLPTGGVSNVPDGRPARIFIHQVGVFGPMVDAENLGDRAYVLVGVDELLPIRIIGSNAGGQLAAVLDV